MKTMFADSGVGRHGADNGRRTSGVSGGLHKEITRFGTNLGKGRGDVRIQDLTGSRTAYYVAEPLDEHVSTTGDACLRIRALREVT